MKRDDLFKVFLTLLAVCSISVGAMAQQITVNGVDLTAFLSCFNYTIAPFKSKAKNVI